MWLSGNSTGHWVDPTVFVIGLVLIAATFVAAIALVAGWVATALDDGDSNE